MSRYAGGGLALLATAAVAALLGPASPAAAAPQCHASYGTTDAAKSNKLFLYFPTAADATFPAYAAGVSPANPFDVAGLNPAIGTTAALRDRIYDVVADDYCEFNVQVLQTTTNPASLPSPPPRRTTVAIGSDANGTSWGLAQEVDTGDTVPVDFARVWAGTYVSCEGTPCSGSGSLTGTNATVDNWARAIGGTAAHEAGHTYGLAHTDDNPTTDTTQPGPAPRPGEDAFNRHLMPSGNNLTGPDRASYRRHFSDRTFGLLATNVGLSVQTMHNWDLVNPNGTAARSLTIDFLSHQSSLNIDWTYDGPASPWISPTVSGPLGTTVFRGSTWNRFRLTYTAPNPTWTGPAGTVPAGGTFHVGTSFTGVDFNQPDPIVIQDLTLVDASSNALTLHPRLPMYDTGTLDAADGTFGLQFFAPAGAAMQLQSATIFLLPRMASIDSMIGDGAPRTWDGDPIAPWSSTTCAPQTLEKTLRCIIAKRTAKPHVQSRQSLGQKGVVDCSQGPPPAGASSGDRSTAPDDEGPVCAGIVRDPFPSATVYAIATFVDPAAKHWDPRKKGYVVGPVTTKVFYQFAGIRHLDQAAPMIRPMG